MRWDDTVLIIIYVLTITRVMVIVSARCRWGTLPLQCKAIDLSRLMLIVLLDLIVIEPAVQNLTETGSAWGQPKCSLLTRLG